MSSPKTRRSNRFVSARSHARRSRQCFLESLELRRMMASDFGFAHAIGGTSNESATAVTTDAQGNSYVAGNFSSFGTDFDPATSTSTLLNPVGSQDAFVAKYSSTGSLLWARSFGGGSVDSGADIAVDADGNVLVTGNFIGTIDLDPGPGVFNVSGDPVGAGNVYVSKLDTNGNFVWGKSFGSSNGGEFVDAIAVDASGAVYTTGQFNGSGDFDPGPGVTTLASTSTGDWDIFVSKLNSDGSFAWAKRFGGSGSSTGDMGLDLAVDAAGNVVTTGNFRGSADFDPGPGLTILNSGSSSADNIFVSKLNSSGDFVWARAFVGIAPSRGHSVAIDSAGNVYTGGEFQGTVDFDPGPGQTLLSDNFGNFDAFLTKLDASGNFVWARRWGGDNGPNVFAITLDQAGRIYATGQFGATADFDPGPGVVNLTSLGSVDVFVSTFDSDGNFLDVSRMGGIGLDRGRGIAVDSSGGIVTVGQFQQTADFDPGPGVQNRNSRGSDEIFISRLLPPSPPVPGSISGTKWIDADGDGLRDAGEGPMANVVVYLDQNNNGALDATEASALTDANGNYLFAEVMPGDYFVREVVPADYRQTSPGIRRDYYVGYDPAQNHLLEIDAANGAVTRTALNTGNVDFQGIIVTRAGMIIGLDPAQRTLYQVDRLTGTISTIASTSTPLGGGLAYDPSSDTVYVVSLSSASPPRLHSVDLATGTFTPLGTGTTLLQDLGGLTFDRASRQVVAFDRVDGQFIGFDLSGNAGVLFTSFFNSSGLAHNGTAYVQSESFTSNRLLAVNPATGARTQILTLSQSVFTLSLEFVRAAPLAHIAMVGSGEAVTGLDFGNQFVLGEIRGAKFYDANGNGLWDATESPQEGVVIYLDANNDGQLQTTERSTLTDAEGQYVFSNVAPGMHVVREILPEFHRQTKPGMQADFYYAVDNNGQRNQLIKIDAQSGRITRIGTRIHDAGVVGLAYTNAGRLYGVTAANTLVEIDTATGIGTTKGNTLFSVGFGLAYDSVTDTIYGVATVGNNTALVTFNRETGAATPIGTGITRLTSTSGIAFDSITRRVLVFNNQGNDQIWSFNPADGAAQLLSTTNLNNFVLAHNGSQTVGFDGNTNRTLIAINPATGAAIPLVTTSELVALNALEFVNLEPFAYVVNLQPAQAVSGLDFGNQDVRGSLSGTKWEDFDGDGVRDAGEPAMSEVTVYLDVNNNGVHDSSEPATTTGEDGSYRFDRVLPGRHIVREIIPPDYRQTSPGIQAKFYLGFDSNSSRIVKVDPTTGAVTYLGNPGAIPQRMHGVVQTSRGEVFGISGFDDALYRINLTTGIATLVGFTGLQLGFGLTYDPETDTIYGVAVPPSGPSSSVQLVTFDRTTGAVSFVGTQATPNIGGTTGLAFDPITKKVLLYDWNVGRFYAFDTSGGLATPLATRFFNATSMTDDGRGNVLLEANGTLLRVNPYDGSFASLFNFSQFVRLDALELIDPPTFAHDVFLTPAENRTGLDFGNQFVLADIRGTKWNDLDGDGTRDAGEPGMANVTVYLDLDRDGVLDPADEPSVTTDAEGNYVFENQRPGNYLVREIVPFGYQQTSPGVRGDYYYALGFNQLHRIDAQTGQVTFIGTASAPQLEGLIRTNSGELFAISGPENTLWSINPANGQARRIGPTINRIAWGLAYDPLTDTIYGLAHPNNNDPSTVSLCTYDRTTGAVTIIGPAWTDLNATSGLTFDPVTQRIIAFDNADKQFWAFDRNGNRTFLGTVPITAFGLATNDRGQLVMFEGNFLVVVDPATGQKIPQFVASAGLPPLGGLDFVNNVDFGHTVMLNPAEDVSGIDFGNEYILGEIRGSKWNDLDQDGTRDADEPSLAGVQIYIDTNLNGVLDQGERTQVTDSDGNYLFDEVFPGSYVVREVVPEGYVQSSPGVEPDYYYGLNNGQELVRIDAASGAVTSVGFANVGTNLHGIVQTNSGELFAVSGWENSLFSINPATGQATRIGFTSHRIAWGLAYDPITDTLYGLAHPSPSNTSTVSLATYNRTTGATTLIGPAYTDVQGTLGLTFDRKTQRIIAFDNFDRQLWAFDRQGNRELLGTYPNLAIEWGLASTAAGDLIVKQQGSTALSKLDLATGALTPVVSLSRGMVLEGLELVDVPDFAHSIAVGKRETVVGIDFGNYNPAPVITRLDVSPATIAEGGEVTLSGDFIDVGLESRWVEIIWGDGSTDTLQLGATDRTFSLSHKYLDDHPSGTSSDDYEIVVRVLDDAQASLPAESIVTVTNVAPTIDSLESDSSRSNTTGSGEAVVIVGSFTDPGVSDTHTAIVDWGDGTTSVATLDYMTMTFTASHVYSAGGIYPIVVMLADDDLGQAMAETEAVVEGVGVVDGTLYVIGTPENDLVLVHHSTSQPIHVHADFLSVDPVIVDPLSVEKLVILLGDGNDVVVLANSVDLPALIDGGSGDDLLNGGRGTNILLGGSGNDLLLGGNSRDLLIGGNGADTLLGQSGDDLLISGTTSYDHDADALWAILAEWNSANDYQTRVANLTSGGGLNGSIVLNGEGENQTVFNDDDLDLLVGAAGVDWYFAQVDTESQRDLVTAARSELIEDV